MKEGEKIPKQALKYIIFYNNKKCSNGWTILYLANRVKKVHFGVFDFKNVEKVWESLRECAKSWESMRKCAKSLESLEILANAEKVC